MLITPKLDLSPECHLLPCTSIDLPNRKSKMQNAQNQTNSWSPLQSLLLLQPPTLNAATLYSHMPRPKPRSQLRCFSFSHMPHPIHQKNYFGFIFKTELNLTAFHLYHPDQVIKISHLGYYQASHPPRSPEFFASILNMENKQTNKISDFWGPSENQISFKICFISVYKSRVYYIVMG